MEKTSDSTPKSVEKPTTVNSDRDMDTSNTAKDSYVKLAMRNMVRKGRRSLWHFFLTTAGLIGLLVGLAYLTKP